MEAEPYAGPLAKPNIIAVYATKEEWRAVVHRITQVSPLAEDDSDKLVYHLINMGVHE